MLSRLKRAWTKFKKRKPGSRFTQMYEERQRATKSPLSRALHVLAGVIIIGAGIVALPMPGPGMLIIALGAAFVARESEWLATRLDRLEVWARDW